MSEPNGTDPERAAVVLRARWVHLAMLHWEVDRALLAPLVPRGVTLDERDGAVHLGAVGFLFRDTRILGVAVPFHVNFPELNLRFYVRREAGGSVRRGVVFVKELVPRRLVALVARALYNEKYVSGPMSHGLVLRADGSTARAVCGFRIGGAGGRLAMETEAAGGLAPAGSREEFFSSRERGWVVQRDGGTVEYAVAHPPWVVRRATSASMEGDLRALWGEGFASVLGRPPDHAFLAEGSAVTVRRGVRIVP